MSLLHIFVEQVYVFTSDKEEAAIVAETDQSKPVSPTAIDQSKLQWQ